MNPTLLTKLFPKSKVLSFLPYWDEISMYAELNTPERKAMFFAQVGHECQGFTRFVESLNYSAQGLANTWPNRYSVSPKAKKKLPNTMALNIARNPEMIANITYANRMGNGPAGSGDGWLFRGRGLIMTTGRENYTAIDKSFQMEGEIVSNPDMLEKPYWAIKSAAYFWKRKNLNDLSDKENVQGAREIINGGLIGVDQVEALYRKLMLGLAS